MRTKMTVVLAILASGCAGSGGGVSVEVRATSSGLAASGPVTVQDASGAEVVVEEARISVQEIRLELPDGTVCSDVEADLSGATCQDEDSDHADDHPSGEIRVTGPFLVDLLAGTSEPDLSQVKVPDLAYEEVKIEPARSAALGGASFVISGTVNGEPMSVALRLDNDIEIQKPGGVRTSAGAPLLVEFDTTTWFAALSLSQCSAGGGVTVDDDDGEDCELEDELEHALEESGDIDRHEQDHEED